MPTPRKLLRSIEALEEQSRPVIYHPLGAFFDLVDHWVAPELAAEWQLAGQRSGRDQDDDELNDQYRLASLRVIEAAKEAGADPQVCELLLEVFSEEA